MFENVTYISAGAGSGKTYTLVNILSKHIGGASVGDPAIKFDSSLRVKPNEVILTTFTEKAAAEFREKSKGALCKAGMFAEADMLDNACVGTIDSVCFDFVRRYWYKLGISPSVRLVDEQTEAMLRECAAKDIADAVADKDGNTYKSLLREFIRKYGLSYDDWSKLIRSVISLAQQYRCVGIEDSDPESKHKWIEQCKEESNKKIELFFNPQNSQVDVSVSDIRSVLLSLSVLLEQGLSNNKSYRQKCSNYLSKCNSPDGLSVLDKFSIGSFLQEDHLTKKLVNELHSVNPIAKDVSDRLFDIYNSRGVVDDMKRYASYILDLSLVWMERYKECKRKNNLISYDDMEAFFLQLLDDDEVRREIGLTYKCLLVDEFQDSNPTQVRIFDKLSSLIDKCYFCGDSKQSIYGFRGADTELVESVVNEIEKHTPSEILSVSYRSESEIVDLTNKIFVKMFRGSLSENKIRLAPSKKKDVNDNRPSLLFESVKAKNKDLFSQYMAVSVSNYISDYNIKERDIAVLTRTNSEANEIAAALFELGIKVNRESGELNNTKEFHLIVSILTLFVDNGSDLSRAIVKYLVSEGCSLKNIINSKISFNIDKDSDEWCGDDALFEKIKALRSEYSLLSVSDIVRRMVAEFDIRGLVSKFGDCVRRWRNIDRLIEIADEYEQNCADRVVPSTLSGYIEYISTLSVKSSSDNEGVTVITYHQSKGLEWDTVFLCSLDKKEKSDYMFMKDTLFGAQVTKFKSAESDVFPSVLVSVVPNVIPGRTALPGYIQCNILKTTEYNDARHRSCEESKRLLYVGMTRPKRTLIPVVKVNKDEDPKNNNSKLLAFDYVGYKTSLPDELSSMYDVFDVGIPIKVLRFDSSSSVSSVSEKKVEKALVIKDSNLGSDKFKPLFFQPSSIVGKSNATIKSRLNPPLQKPDVNDYADFGDTVHNLMCVYGRDMTKEKVSMFMKERGYDVDDSFSEGLLVGRKELDKYIEKTYGEIKTDYREMPFSVTYENRMCDGFIDLLYETVNGYVIVDYKTFSGDENLVMNTESEFYVGKYGGQLGMYRKVIVSAGLKCLATIIYYPMIGVIAELS